MSVNFSMLDWAVVGLYFLIIAGIAVWVALQKERNTSDYFLASRDATWFLIGALDLRLEHRRRAPGGPGGLRRRHGHGVRALGAALLLLLIVLGWVFAPFYLRSKIFTTPEFLEERYTPGTRTALSLIFLTAYILTKASVTIYAGAIAIKTILGFDSIDLPGSWECRLLLVLGIRAGHRDRHLYRGPGGIKAVLRTEGHAGAATADRLDRHSAWWASIVDRRPRRTAGGQPRYVLAVAPAAASERRAGCRRNP